MGMRMDIWSECNLAMLGKKFGRPQANVTARNGVNVRSGITPT